MVSQKKGGPRSTGKGTQLQVRVHDPLLSALDAYFFDRPEPRPSRPEAIREGLSDWLTGLGYLPHRKDPEMAN